MPQILVVDDEPAVLSFLKTLLQRDGHEVTCAKGGPQAQEALQLNRFDLMITDYMMTPMTGMELLSHVQSNCPSMPTVMISGYCTVENAVSVLRAGAFDYLPKPVKVNDLRDIVSRALEYHDALVRKEAHQIRRALGDIVTESAVMEQVCDTVRRVMLAECPALILGEKGTGKQLIARTIHEGGSRQNGAFVSVDCRQRPGEELEARLFGPADAGEQGALAEADGGTLFLEEVGSLPLGLQERFEQFLADDGANLSIIASSSDPLSGMVAKGNFRSPLYQRLGIFCMSISPLRERPEDVIGIAYTMLHKQNGNGTHTYTLDPETELLLEHYPWPGNGDELQSALEEAVRSAQGAAIRPADLPRKIRQQTDLAVVKQQRKSRLAEYKGQALKSFLRGKEQEYLATVLESVGDDKAEAARKLNLSADGLDRHISGDRA